MSMTTYVHVNIPRGHYIGQTRGYGRRRWITVTRRHKNPEKAMAAAVVKMRPDDYRARAIFVDNSGWYEPNIVMECRR